MLLSAPSLLKSKLIASCLMKDGDQFAIKGVIEAGKKTETDKKKKKAEGARGRLASAERQKKSRTAVKLTSKLVGQDSASF